MIKILKTPAQKYEKQEIKRVKKENSFCDCDGEKQKIYTPNIFYRLLHIEKCANCNGWIGQTDF